MSVDNMNGINQRTRIWTPKEVLLAQMYAVGTDAIPSTVIAFTVPTPDARVQVNIALLAVPAPTLNLEMPFDVLGDVVTAGLWLAAAEKPQAGGGLLPVTNLVGTRAVPQAVPLDPACMVYAETILSDCDAIMGELTIAASEPSEGDEVPPPLQWVLKTRYQPVAGCVLCDEEWAEIVSKCNPRLVGLPLLTELAE